MAVRTALRIEVLPGDLQIVVTQLGELGKGADGRERFQTAGGRLPLAGGGRYLAGAGPYLQGG
jgi:hypothetical protein